MSDIVDTSPLGIERTERIAGDEALNSRLDTVTTELQSTQESVTTEVLHRSEGDLVIQRILEGYIQDLLEGKAEDFERYIEFQNSQNLNYADVRNFVSSIRASLAEDIRTLTASLMSNLETNDARYNKLVSDVDRYLEILSDVTLDSNQITLDDGELRAGAWTILSQAREWDLQILQKLNGLSTSVGESLKDAVEDLQNQIPSTEQTISKAIEELSKSSVITKLSDALNNVTTTQSDLLRQQVEEAVTRAQEISNLALIQATELANEKQALADQISLEAQERIDAITREREVRLNLIEELENGFTSRFDLIETEQSTSFTAFNNYKASTDDSLANFNTSINLISEDLASQGSVVNALDLRLKDTEETAASAVTKSEAALTETSAQAEIINGITASLADKADASALSTLGTEISDLDGKLSLNTSSITQLQGSLDNVNDELSNKASLTALNSLSGDVATIGNQTFVNTNDLTNLKNKVDVVEGAVAVKLDASVISDYYTKGQADDKSAEIVAGKIESYDANLVIGGVNLFSDADSVAGYVAPDNGEVSSSTASHQSMKTLIPLGSHKSITYQVWNPAGITNTSNINRIAFFKADGSFLSATALPGLNGTTYQTTLIQIPDAATHARLGVLAGPVSGARDEAVKVKFEFGNKPTVWTPSVGDVQSNLDANAKAIRNTETVVATIDGKVNAQAADILSLNTNLTNLNNSKLDASIIQQYRTAVEQDSVTAGSITQFSSALKLGGDNLFTGTKTFNNESSENSNSSFQPSYGGFGGGSQVFIPYGLFGTHTVVRTSSNWCGFYLKEADWLGWEAREDLVLSFWANADADVYVYGIASQLGHVATISANKPMMKYEVLIPKGTPLRNAANQGIVEFSFPNGGTLWYGAVMLQIGTKSTAWQPSSKESDAAVSSLATAITETNTRVGNVENGIASHANKLTGLSSKLNERKVYQLYSGGLDSATGGMGWLRGFDPSSYYDIGRSYGLVVFNGDGSIQSVNSYDVYGGNIQGFNDAVAAVPIGTYVAVLTSDEPRANKEYIKASLKSLGGSDAIDQVVRRGAYLLVGRKGLPSGQAIEKVSNTASFGVDYVLEMFNGVPIGLGGSSPQSDIISNMRTEVSSMAGNVKSISETVTVHTASLDTIAKGTYSKSHVLDLRGLDENLYYPVIMRLSTSPSSKLRVLRTLDSFPERPSWSTHGAGFDCKLEWTATGEGWGTTSRDLTILANDYRWASAVPFLGLGQVTESSLEYVHLRGGAQYYLDTSSSAENPRIITSVETHHGSVLAPMSYADSHVISAPDLKLKASASALEQTRSEVRNIDGNVSSQASKILTLESDNAANKNALTVQSRVIDGVKASYMVKMESNGVVGGFGMIQESGAMGVVFTSFGVSADSFFIGAPAGGKKPFIVTTYPQDINGVTYPAGTWIDVALIANATIGTAHIANASITDAKIANIDAAKITTGTLDAGRIRVGSSTQFDSGFAPTDVLNNAKTYTDAIEVGGRNLFLNSKVLSGGNDGSSLFTVTPNYIEVTNLRAGGYIYVFLPQNTGISDSEDVAYSVDCETAGNPIFFSNLHNANTVPSSQTVNGKMRIKCTSKGVSGLFFVRNDGPTNATMRLSNFKMERGNKATDWTPAPEDVDTAIAAKAKTFTAQPAPPYTAGDLWKDGSTIRVCTVTRTYGSYVGSDWVLVGDVTSANTAADSNQLGGRASATVFSDITGAKNAADAAALKASAAENQLTLWKYPNTTEIDGGKIRTNSITANQISVANLSAISSNLGTIKVGTANIDDLAVETIKIKDNAVTSLLEVQRTQQRVEQNFSYIPANTLTSIKIKVVLMSGLSKNNRYLVYWRGVIGAGMGTRLSNTPQYLGWARKRVYFGSTSSTDIVGNRILVETNQLNGNYIKWYDNNAASTGNVTQWNVAEGVVDETGSLCLWVDVEWKSFADNIPADTFYGYLLTSDLSVLISEFKK